MYQLPNVVNKLIDQVSSLPGIGPKTATKLVLSLLSGDMRLVDDLSLSLKEVSAKIVTCSMCGNIVESQLTGEQVCSICEASRDDSIMIVESVLDLINIENSGAFGGYYHVLGGLVSPLRAKAFDDLNIASLLSRISEPGFDKIICALPSNVEGDTTALLLKDAITSRLPTASIYRLGRGVPSGANIEFLDFDTLKNSITNISRY